METGSDTTPQNVDGAQPLVEAVDIPEAGTEGQKTAPPENGEATPQKVESPEQQEAKKQSRFQRMRDRERGARVAAETETRLLREELARVKSQSSQQQEPREPQRDQFEDYEQYLRAVTKYDATQAATAVTKADREASHRAQQQRQSNQGAEKVAQTWVEREKAFILENKDYEEVVVPYVEDSLGSLSDAARRQILDSGPQLLAHLAKNPDLHDEIAELSPRDQKTELAKLAAKISDAPAKRVSHAPPPMKPVDQGRNASNGYHEGMSQEEYETMRVQSPGGARWARSSATH